MYGRRQSFQPGSGGIGTTWSSRGECDDASITSAKRSVTLSVTDAMLALHVPGKCNVGNVGNELTHMFLKAVSVSLTDEREHQSVSKMPGVPCTGHGSRQSAWCVDSASGMSTTGAAHVVALRVRLRLCMAGDPQRGRVAARG